MALHHGGLGNVSSPFSVTRANKICGKPGPLSLVGGCYGLCPDALFTVSVPTVPAAGGGQGAAVPHTGNRTQPWDLPARLCPVPGDGRGQRQANVRWQRPVPPSLGVGRCHPSSKALHRISGSCLASPSALPCLARSLPGVSPGIHPQRELFVRLPHLRARPLHPQERRRKQRKQSWLRLPLPPKLRHRC